MFGHNLVASILYLLAVLCFVGAVVAFFGLAHTPAGWVTLGIVALILVVLGAFFDRRAVHGPHV